VSSARSRAHTHAHTVCTTDDWYAYLRRWLGDTYRVPRTDYAFKQQQQRQQHHSVSNDD
jgi:hypothetical protein